MDVLLRVIAVIVELIILFAIFFFVLAGVRLLLFDLGISKKYSKILAMAFIAVGAVIAVFLISHLSAFYPVI
jgi:succinate dehydrogenase/fumarate reductase cytochrome b subunit